MLSLIIPTWNHNEMALECITAVRENTQDCEIIVIDNGSDPPFVKPYTGFIDITVIRNETNLGFPVAVNQGIMASKGDIIILLNDDVVVTPEWATKLTSALQECSIVGAVTNYSSGVQRNDIGTYENKSELNKAVNEWEEDYEGEILEVRWVIGFCMAFPRSLFDEIGPFDESIWPCCGEEIDFCLRAGEAGHRVGIAFDCYVHHEGSVTFKEMNSEHPYSEIIERNNKHLEKRWGKGFGVQLLDDNKGLEVSSE